MRFEFATANRIIFGEGCIRELAPAASSFGRQALFILGKTAKRAAAAIRALQDAGVQTTEFHVSAEPTVELVLDGLEKARSRKCDIVIGMGGGSAIDAGKAIAALLPNPGEILDYLEVFGEGQTLPSPSLPFVAIPTTAGTGSEATRNAVLTVTEKRAKVSLRGPSLLPRLAIVDPALTYDLPKEVTAASGFDALVQLVEPFVSVAANPMTDALCRNGIRLVARSIRRAYEDGADREARAAMALAALFSGMALANAKLGAVHGFAGPIGGSFSAPHGAICARLLPVVVQANLMALRRREPQSSTLRRFDELGSLLTGSEAANGKDGVAWLRELCAEFQIPPLRTYGLTAADFPEVIAQADRSSSMKGNPVVLTNDELTGILEQAL
ncbi:MAG: iron-containing alcohol dehydrogenase [Chloroflexota bacterium]